MLGIMSRETNTMAALMALCLAALKAGAAVNRLLTSFGIRMISRKRVLLMLKHAPTIMMTRLSIGLARSKCGCMSRG